MSRRRRVELQKAAELKNEEAEEEDVFKVQLERIFAPLVWMRLSNGIRIQDLKEPYYEEVLQMFRDYYIQEEVLCRNSDMVDDEVSIQSFLDKLLFNIKNKTSIIAIHEYIVYQKKPCDSSSEEDEVEGEQVEGEQTEGEQTEGEQTENAEQSQVQEEQEPPVEGEEKEIPQKKKKKKKRKWAPPKQEIIEEITMQDLIGCCVMTVVNKADYGRVFSRVQISHGEALRKVLEIKNYLSRKVDIYARFNCEVFLRYYAICIKPKYRHQGLGLQFLRCGLDSARAMKIPVVAGVFSDYKLQRHGKRIGMEVMMEINYVNWRNKEDGELIFEDPGAGNYSCMVMAGLVPPPPPPEPPKPPEEANPKGKGAKMSRSDKRKGKK